MAKANSVDLNKLAQVDVPSSANALAAAVAADKVGANKQVTDTTSANQVVGLDNGTTLVRW